jgi:hypothetical protein
MKRGDWLLLAVLGGGAYLLYRTSQKAAEIPGQLAGDIWGALMSPFAGLFGQPGPPGPPGEPSAADYQALIDSMVLEYQEYLKRQQEKAEQPPAPPGQRLVQVDTGEWGYMPTAPISKEEVLAGLSPAEAAAVSPSRLAYQAEIGIPILTDAQYRAMQAAASTAAQAAVQAPTEQVVGRRVQGGVTYDIVKTAAGTTEKRVSAEKWITPGQS